MIQLSNGSKSGRGSYQEKAERVKYGNELIVVAKDSEAYKLEEVLYQSNG